MRPATEASSLPRRDSAGIQRIDERWRSRALAVLVTGMLAALCASLGAPPATRAAFNGVNGRIAFVSSRDGNYEVYSMNADGSDQVNLSGNPAGDLAPSWSPDGTKLVFTSFRDGGNAEIYVMNSDGTGQSRLTNDPAVDTNPAWSPDGAKIAFRSDRDGGDYEIYSMNADGSAQMRLTASAGVDDMPAWSPNGSTIAFQSARGGDSEIYAMNANGSSQVDLTNNPYTDRNPSWSPGGQKIAFDTSRDGNFEVYSMNAGGTAQTDLTAHTSDDSEPAWSPDGAKITFRSQRDGNAEIYSMSSSGSGLTRLTNGTVFDNNPDWQPAIPGFPRPRGATPLRASLVIAYTTCSNPNQAHGPPLVAPSCSPPVQASRNLTVGTLDSNGLTPSFVGFVRFSVRVGVPGPPEDSDVLLVTSMSDIRCRSGGSACQAGPLSDYSGEVQTTSEMRIVDKYSGLAPTGGFESATAVDTPMSLTVSCTPTSGSAGANCFASTSMNAVLPGAIKDGKRELMQLSQVKVMDGGSDGVVSTPSNDLFAIQGVFVP